MSFWYSRSACRKVPSALDQVKTKGAQRARIDKRRQIRDHRGKAKQAGQL